MSFHPNGFAMVIWPFDTDLVVFSDAQDHIVFQYIEGVIHGVHCQVCWPLKAHLGDRKVIHVTASTLKGVKGH